MEQAERAELIRALLNGLPPQDRAIFLRHYYYGQTAADIGAALAMPAVHGEGAPAPGAEEAEGAADGKGVFLCLCG